MVNRRGFLKAAGGAALLGRTRDTRAASAPHAVLLEARALIRTSRLGPIGFCRVAHPDLLPAAQFVLEQRPVIAEVDAAAEGVNFLGSHATLFVSGGEMRVFERSETEEVKRQK